MPRPAHHPWKRKPSVAKVKPHLRPMRLPQRFECCGAEATCPHCPPEKATTMYVGASPKAFVRVGDPRGRGKRIVVQWWLHVDDRVIDHGVAPDRLTALQRGRAELARRLTLTQRTEIQAARALRRRLKGRMRSWVVRNPQALLDAWRVLAAIGEGAIETLAPETVKQLGARPIDFQWTGPLLLDSESISWKEDGTLRIALWLKRLRKEMSE